MSILDESFVLVKAEVYTDPANSSDSLPVVYGDLTDGITGNWQIPCIDTVNFVYAYCSHEVMSVANGNVIKVYKDDVLVSSGYTFSHSDPYEGQGSISTITFTADQGNSKIAVTGEGKDDGGGVVTDNIVDILYDFLTVENDFTSSDFDLTKKSMVWNTFESKSYIAAGVIVSDRKTWDIIQSMVGSFLGYVYMSGTNLISMNMFDGTDPSQTSQVPIPKHEVEILSAKQRKENLINQCPAYYSYSHNEKKYLNYTDELTYIGVASQNIYGVQIPRDAFELHWCRDLTSVQTIQQLVTDKYSYPIWEISFIDNTFKRLSADIGDVIAITTEELYDTEQNFFTERLVEIIGMNPDFKKSRVKFSVIDTGVSL